MSPVPTAIWEQNQARPVPVEPFPTAEVYCVPTMEIVVDWQLADQERNS